MDRLRLLLINPTAPDRRAQPGSHTSFPRLFRFSMLSSMYVAASVPSYVETRILDEDLEPIRFDAPADLVGISCMTYNAPRAYELARVFREQMGIPVILGGYHPTLLPQEAVEHADSICIGDAETVVHRMIEDFAAGRLAPTYHAHAASLAGLPLPRRDLISRDDYLPLDAIQATRGCPLHCTFCSIAAFHRHRLRCRPVEEVIDELGLLGRHVLFMDDCLTGDREYAAALFERMIPLRKTWFSQAGIDLAFDDELLQLAARSGCRGLFIGFEALSRGSLASWHKDANLTRDYHEAVRRLHAAGIAVYAGFVFGADDHTPDVFPATLEFLLDANIESLQATRLTPFPGTPLFALMERQGRIQDHDWSHYDFGHVVFQPQRMSRTTLDQGVAWVQSQFFSRRHIVRRAWKGLRYLGPSVVARAVLPLNLSYRTKMSGRGVFGLGEQFRPSNIGEGPPGLHHA